MLFAGSTFTLNLTWSVTATEFPQLYGPRSDGSQIESRTSLVSNLHDGHLYPYISLAVITIIVSYQDIIQSCTNQLDNLGNGSNRIMAFYTIQLLSK